MSSARQRRVDALRDRVGEISPAEAVDRIARGAALVDIRDSEEIAQGMPEGARHIPRGYLEMRIEETVPSLETPVLVLCASGARSLFAAGDLLDMGYREVHNIAGGFNRWKDDGLPFTVPRMLDAGSRERYARHLLMPEVGEEGQLKLLDSRVLLIGAGGLGSPCAFYLAAAGIGTLGIVDHDVVDRSNLQRQILHTDAAVGTPKVESARERLLALNPDIDVIGIRERLSSENVERLFADYDVIVDGSDNFPTRYLINDACVKLGRPNVHGAVYRFEGQVSVFHTPGARGGDDRGPCYRCLFPEPPPPELAPSCAEAGVLGILPGVMGLLQAVETIKLLIGRGDPLIGRMIYYDALDARFTELKIPRDPDCPYCGDGKRFPGYIDYEQFCATAVTT